MVRPYCWSKPRSAATQTVATFGVTPAWATLVVRDAAWGGSTAAPGGAPGLAGGAEAGRAAGWAVWHAVSAIASSTAADDPRAMRHLLSLSPVWRELYSIARRRATLRRVPTARPP